MLNGNPHGLIFTLSCGGKYIVEPWGGVQGDEGKRTKSRKAMEEGILKKRFGRQVQTALQLCIIKHTRTWKL